MRCVTGAYMAIGLKYGNNAVGDEAAVSITAQKRAEFNAKFSAMHKHIVCRDLLGLDFGKPEDMPKIMQSGLTGTLCPKLIADACDVLDEILA